MNLPIKTISCLVAESIRKVSDDTDVIFLFRVFDLLHFSSDLITVFPLELLFIPLIAEVACSSVAE